MIVPAALGLVLLASAAQSEKKDVKWITKYQDALQIAQKEGKPLILDAGREA
jgi:hypothetical protein